MSVNLERICIILEGYVIALFFSAMVKKLDDSVGDIVESLLTREILNNTVIVFVSDNGGITSGSTQNYASNWPLRGLKMSPFEGGVRVAGLIWSAAINNSQHLWNGYMHVTDWMPTLLRIAGSDVPTGINGIDQWRNINLNIDSDRHEIFEIDDYHGFASIVSGDYKLVTGNVLIANSNYEGENLRGIIGDEPLYIDAVKDSKVYNALSDISKPFNLENINLRNDIRIHCNINRIGKDICYPHNGM